MDVSSFLSGNYLTHLDLPQPLQCWTISKTAQQLVGTDQKVCITFGEFPAKPLGLNKTNLRRVAELFGLDAIAWTGMQMQVYRSTTDYGGKAMQCVRICGPQQLPPEGVCDANGNPVAPQPPAVPVPAQQPVAVAPQPVAVPQPELPVAAPQPTPWGADQAALQQNSPPSA